MGVLILNYHRIFTDSEEIPKGLDGIYNVSEHNFIQQIEKIIALKIPVISLSEIPQNTKQKELCVALTIDDGNSSDFEIVFPILKKFNLPASFFVLVNDEVNWNQLKEMSNSAYEIGSHGLNHTDLTKLKTKALKEELLMSKTILEKKLSIDIKGFSFPFGRYNRDVIQACKQAGYAQMFSTRFGENSSQNQIYTRWSLKSTTTLVEFENVLTSSTIRNKKEKASKLKHLISRGIGKKATDALNEFLHKNLNR